MLWHSHGSIAMDGAGSLALLPRVPITCTCVYFRAKIKKLIGKTVHKIKMKADEGMQNF